MSPARTGLREQYGAFNEALSSLYRDDLLTLADEDEPTDFDEGLFEEAARELYESGGFDIPQLASPAARAVVEETMRVLDTAISSALPHEVPETLRHALENNAFIFSGFKTFHSLREVGLSMVTDKGDIKPFPEFLDDVRKINAKYNRNYLHAEYNHALGASQMAAKWHDIEQDGDDYDLQYRTAGDSRVREEHAALHGTTLPPSDPFWERYLPPNGWNCRCTAVQVRRNKYPRSDSQEAIRLGDECTAGPKKSIFRYNPGKTMELFPPKHPYLPKGCGNCDRKLSLAYDPKREACRVCTIISGMARLRENKRLYDRLSRDAKYINVEFDEKSGGVKATHRGHNTPAGTKQFFGNTIAGSDLEREVQNLLFRSGHSVIFCDEQKRGKDRNTLPALDMALDGSVMEIRSITVRKQHYGAAIVSKNKQINNYNQRSDVKVKADTLCLYFHDPKMYSKGRIIEGIKYAKGKTSSFGIKRILCLINEKDGPKMVWFET